MLIAVGVLAGLVVVSGFVLGLHSQGMTPTLGLQGGALRPCPDSPNCVCSEPVSHPQPQHAIEPLHPGSTPAAKAWTALQQAIVQQGGTIVTFNDDYLHATFTSHLFRFVDDVEARFDHKAGIIQLRSASRVGRSDLGVNRKRVEAIRQTWSRLLGS